MKVNRLNPHPADLTAKVAFGTRLIVLLAAAIALQLIIAKVGETVHDCHLKQQKQRQGQISKQD
jgi:hypothetical protein